MRLYRRVIAAISVLLVSIAVASAAGKDLKILAIGNSFSEDAVEQNLWNLFDAAGKDVIVANMYIGGCSLERHSRNVASGEPAYRYRKIVDGVRTQEDRFSLASALLDEEWDVITIQQASGDSGEYETYRPYLDEVISYIRSLHPHTLIYFHQTWSYSKDSDHNAFPKYGNDQMRMYSQINECCKKVLDDFYEICAIIPSGTAIQNARTTPFGDTMNRDGYHLDLSYGRYTAACAWFETLSGESVVGNTYHPESMSAEQAEWAQWAAHEAARKPFSVTEYK